MAERLQWHGLVICPECGVIFDERGDSSINEVRVADKHSDPKRGPGHGVTQRLHRTDYCETLGCGKVPEVPAS